MPLARLDAVSYFHLQPPLFSSSHCSYWAPLLGLRLPFWSCTTLYKEREPTSHAIFTSREKILPSTIPNLRPHFQTPTWQPEEIGDYFSKFHPFVPSWSFQNPLHPQISISLYGGTILPGCSWEGKSLDALSIMEVWGSCNLMWPCRCSTWHSHDFTYSNDVYMIPHGLTGHWFVWSWSYWHWRTGSYRTLCTAKLWLMWYHHRAWIKNCFVKTLCICCGSSRDGSTW